MESPFRATGLSPADRAPGLEVIETLAFDGTRPLRAARHLDRAAATCAALGAAFDRAGAEALLNGLPRGAPLRLRLSIAADTGQMRLQTAPLQPAPARWRVALASARLDPDDPWLRHKTSRRALYDKARASLPDGVEEWLFANRRDEICEGSITSLFFDLGTGLCTPPLSCGLLPGVLRAEMLDEGRCREALLGLAELPRARLWLGNALRGMIPAELVPPPWG